MGLLFASAMIALYLKKKSRNICNKLKGEYKMNTTIEKQQIVTSNTEQWNMYSKLDGKEYQIHISKPRQPAPESGYPVIYVLDGNAFFKHSMKRLKYNQLEQKNRCFTSHYSRYWLSNRRGIFR